MAQLNLLEYRRLEDVFSINGDSIEFFETHILDASLAIGKNLEYSFRVSGPENYNNRMQLSVDRSGDHGLRRMGIGDRVIARYLDGNLVELINMRQIEDGER